MEFPPPLLRIAGAIVLLGTSLSARESTPLPQRSEEELALSPRERWNEARALWPEGEYKPHTSHEADEEELPRLPVDLALANMQDLPADFQASYFTETPSGSIIDPQHLITNARRDGLRTFLEFHDNEARSHICLLVLDATQRLPADRDLNDLHKRWFGQELTALVVYNFGYPELSRVIFGEYADKKVPEATRRDACLESITESLDATNAEEQLERFITELSRRLYWVEGAFHGAEKKAAKATKPTSEILPERGISAGRAALRAGLLGLSCLVGLGATLLHLQRRAALKSFHFPDRTIHPRLGAPLGGGSRITVHFREKENAARRRW